MTRAATVRQVEVTRALRAAKAAGMEPSGCKIGADGSIQLQFGEAGREAANDFDAMMSNGR